MFGNRFDDGDRLVLVFVANCVMHDCEERSKCVQVELLFFSYSLFVVQFLTLQAICKSITQLTMGSHESQTPLPSDIESLITQLTGRLATLLVTEHTDAIQKPKRNINLNPESSGDEAKIRLIGLLEHLQRQLYEPTDYLKELTQGRVRWFNQRHPVIISNTNI